MTSGHITSEIRDTRPRQKGMKIYTLHWALTGGATQSTPDRAREPSKIDVRNRGHSRGS